MKFRKNILCIILAAVMLACLIPPVAVSAAGTSGGGEDNAGTYSKKVVSVLFDNSGSMRNSDCRDAYAKYAMQTLISLLGPEDTLVITPMNDSSNNTVTNTSHGFEVDLSKADRNAELERVMNTTFLKNNPAGKYTPFSSVGIALQQLVDRGMVTQDKVSFQTDNTEYWLFVLTDGDFTDIGSINDAERKFAEYAGKYSNFHTVYLGLGSDAKDLSKPATQELAATKNFKGYYSKDVADIIQVMQQVANQISGRYTAGSNLYTIDGNKVTIKLDNLDFAIHNLSILMQSSNAVLKSATYKGNALNISQACTIVPGEAIESVLQNGYSALVKPSSGFMAGGEIILNFSDKVEAKNLSLLVEPALKLRTVVECKKGSDWVVGDKQYINSNMSQGDIVRVGYEIYEEGSGRIVQITDLFGAAESTVTYDGKSYNVGDEIALVIGNNDIAVSVSVMDGAYVLYNTFTCIVEANPTYYRIEGSSTVADNGIGNVHDVKFVVYANNKPLSASELSAYEWSVTAKDPSGAPIAVSPAVAADGSIGFRVDLSTLGVFGESSFTAKVVSAEGLPREATVKLVNIPKDIAASVEGEASMSKTQNQLKKNTTPFVFSVSVVDDNGGGGILSPNQYNYKITVDGIDVTSHSKVDGTSIVFVPNAESLGAKADVLGELKVSFVADMGSLASISSEATAKITVTPTVYTVTSEIRGGKVHPFDLDGAPTEILFSVTCDGEHLTEEELLAAYESGELDVNIEGRNFIERAIGAFGVEYTTVTENGTPYLRAVTKSRHFGALACFTGMFVFPGDRLATVSYGGASDNDSFAVDAPGAFAYIWRIIVLFIILHIIMLIVGYRSVARFAPGKYVKLPLTLSEKKTITRAGAPVVVNVGNTFFSRILWRRLFIPCVYWFRGTQTIKAEGGKVILTAANRYPDVTIKNAGRLGSSFIATMLVAESDDYKDIEKRLAVGKNGTQELKNLAVPFDVKQYLFQAPEGKKAPSLWSGQLSGLVRPICIGHSGSRYTFIFFIPDQK